MKRLERLRSSMFEWDGLWFQRLVMRFSEAIGIGDREVGSEEIFHWLWVNDVLLR